METLNFLAVVGSLRAASVNRAVARAAVANLPEDVSMTIRSVADLPLYNGDDEDAGPPAAVTALVEDVAAADGLVLFSPEYNSSLPAVVKNTIDWLSRPPRAWAGTAVTMVATTPGGRAGLGVRTHFSNIMTHQPIRLFEGHGIGSYGDKLDEAGELVDQATIDELMKFLIEFAGFCRATLEE